MHIYLYVLTFICGHICVYVQVYLYVYMFSYMYTYLHMCFIFKIDLSIFSSFDLYFLKILNVSY